MDSPKINRSSSPVLLVLAFLVCLSSLMERWGERHRRGMANVL